MNDYHDIYENRAEEYDQLVAREDHQCNILATLTNAGLSRKHTIVELGCGTGRLTCLISELGNKVHGFDASAAMLRIARAKLKKRVANNCLLAVADHRRLPLQKSTADVLVAGWTLSHLIDDYPMRWQEEMVRVFAEIKRVLRANGIILIFETLGTGHTEPTPPKHLEKYFELLEYELCFSRTWFRTDYHFATIEEAARLTRFFFGEKLALKVLKERWRILPECTGLWFSAPAQS